MFVIADANLLKTILRNLISNAVKYSYVESEVMISTIFQDNKYVISVSDNGVGISNEIIGKLFRIETKYSTPGTLEEMGTGLGLILCKEFVLMHGGTIWVDSIEGEGTSFHFTIPKKQEA